MGDLLYGTWEMCELIRLGDAFAWPTVVVIAASEHCICVFFTAPTFVKEQLRKRLPELHCIVLLCYVLLLLLLCCVMVLLTGFLFELLSVHALITNSLL